MSWQYTVPNIYTEKNFFYCLGIKQKDFKNLVLHKKYHYKVGRQVKKSGGFRTIYKPDEELKKNLQQIYKKYLYSINLPYFVHCGVKNRSIISALRGHNKYEYHLLLDIRAFFDEITLETIVTSLFKINVPGIVITNLTNLCVEDNRLPQGFPTSSYLSSLVLCANLEETVAELQAENIKFSAYADDLLISAESKEKLEEAELKIKVKLKEIGLTLNSKRKFWHKTKTETVLGLNVHPFPAVRRKELKKIQKYLYDNNKNNVKINEEDLKTIKGKISFYGSSNKNKLLEKIKLTIAKQLI